MIHQPSMDGPRAKFNWATQHIDALDSLAASLVDSDAYLITHQINREARQQIWRLDSDPLPSL